MAQTTIWLFTSFHRLLQIFWPSLAFCREEKKKFTAGGGTVWKSAVRQSELLREAAEASTYDSSGVFGFHAVGRFLSGLFEAFFSLFDPKKDQDVHQNF